MLKKTIAYEDFDGNKRTEDFYFNISEAEFAKLELSEVRAFKDDAAEGGFVAKGGFLAKLRGIADRLQGKELMEAFEYILSKAYGVKSEDGKRLIKSDELWKEFTETNAYSDLIIEFFTTPNYAGEFFKGVLPKKYQ